MSCVTNCQKQLESSLLTLFIVHIGCTVALLLIPIVLARFFILLEVRKAHGLVGGSKPYTFLQFQAKCHEHAKYEYRSWGLSHIEDFLDLATGFMLLTSFGIVLPVMSVLALGCHIVEYRLTAYRMVNVNCRPFPRGAEGIGCWQTIFETLSIVAVAINVGIAVFVMHPMRDWDEAQELGAFLVLEHLMLGLGYMISSAIPDEPEDVKRIEDFNMKFKRKFVKQPRIEVDLNERVSIQQLDIGLGLGGYKAGRESDDGEEEAA